MQRTIFKWGNGQGIRLPKTAMEEVHLRVGDTVSITTNGTQIILEKSAPERRNIKELFENFEGTYINFEEV